MDIDTYHIDEDKTSCNRNGQPPSRRVRLSSSQSNDIDLTCISSSCSKISLISSLETNAVSNLYQSTLSLSFFLSSFLFIILKDWMNKPNLELTTSSFVLWIEMYVRIHRDLSAEKKTRKDIVNNKHIMIHDC